MPAPRLRVARRVVRRWGGRTATTTASLADRRHIVRFGLAMRSRLLRVAAVHHAILARNRLPVGDVLDARRCWLREAHL